jgi:hypothetical protein
MMYMMQIELLMVMQILLFLQEVVSTQISRQVYGLGGWLTWANRGILELSWLSIEKIAVVTD